MRCDSCRVIESEVNRLGVLTNGVLDYGAVGAAFRCWACASGEATWVQS